MELRANNISFKTIHDMSLMFNNEEKFRKCMNLAKSLDFSQISFAVNAIVFIFVSYINDHPFIPFFDQLLQKKYENNGTIHYLLHTLTTKDYLSLSTKDIMGHSMKFKKKEYSQETLSTIEKIKEFEMMYTPDRVHLDKDKEQRLFDYSQSLNTNLYILNKWTPCSLQLADQLIQNLESNKMPFPFIKQILYLWCQNEQPNDTVVVSCISKVVFTPKFQYWIGILVINLDEEFKNILKPYLLARSHIPEATEVYKFISKSL
eukprot:NODE_104_length_19952_cov_0.449000.p7 type:complete len:261 gc:universal NODE_104_length_19952_cov_0.449000:8786-8004(-)